MKSKRQRDIKVSIVNPQAIPQASINLTKAIAQILQKK